MQIFCYRNLLEMLKLQLHKIVLHSFCRDFWLDYCLILHSFLRLQNPGGTDINWQIVNIRQVYAPKISYIQSQIWGCKSEAPPKLTSCVSVFFNWGLCRISSDFENDGHSELVGWGSGSSGDGLEDFTAAGSQAVGPLKSSSRIKTSEWGWSSTRGYESSLGSAFSTTSCCSLCFSWPGLKESLQL